MSCLYQDFLISQCSSFVADMAGVSGDALPVGLSLGLALGEIG